MNQHPGDRLLDAWLSLTSTLWNTRIVSSMSFNECHILGILLRHGDEQKPQTATGLIALTHMLKSQMNKVLTTLEQKGFIECTRQGRFTLYRALVPQAEYRKKETAGLLGRYYQNSAKQMVASLVECGRLTDTDLAEIAAMIAKAGDADAV